jgi:hypothetical protein
MSSSGMHPGNMRSDRLCETLSISFAPCAQSINPILSVNKCGGRCRTPGNTFETALSSMTTCCELWVHFYSMLL